MSVILCVDDEPAFLELTRDYLTRSNGFEIDIADSAESALDMMSSRQFDAIVCDYQMPVMDGLELLKLLREQGDDTPFIVFTGRGREEVAIEALNLGADFYLQKGGDTKALFAELANMIDQLLNRRLIELKLIESEEKYRGIFENSGSPMIAADSEGRILLANKEFEELTGMTRGEIEGKTWTTFVHPSSLAVVQRNFEMRRNDPQSAPGSYEIWLNRVDGEKRRVIARPRFLPSKKILISPFTDITSIRQTEQNLARMNRLYAFLSHVNESIVRSSSTDELFPRMCQVAVEHGKFDLAWIGLIDSRSHIVVPDAWAPSDNVDIGKLRIPIDKDDHNPDSLVAAIIDGRIVIRRSGQHVEGYDRMMDPARSLGYHSLAAIPLQNRGEVIGSLNLYSKHADFFSESDIRLLNEVASDISYAINSYDLYDGLEQRSQDLAKKMTELECLYTISELSYRKDLDINLACDRIIDALTLALNKYGTPSIRIEIGDQVCSSKSFSKTSISIGTEITAYGDVLGRLEVFLQLETADSSALSVLEDDRRLVEAVARKIGGMVSHIRMSQELRLERDEAQKYLELANVMIVVIGKNGEVTMINRKGCDVLGYEESEVIGKNWFDNFLPEDVRERVIGIFSSIISRDLERYHQVIDKVLTKTGDTKSILWFNTFLTDESGQVTHTISSGQDLAELNKATASKRRQA